GVGGLVGVDRGSPAHALGTDDTVLVTIKVMNLVHTPLAFKLGLLSAGSVTYVGSMLPMSSKFSNSTVYSNLAFKGVDQISQVARWQKLRLSRWFGDMLDTGNIETGAAPAYLSAGDTGAFPAETDVAVQAFLGVSQNDLNKTHVISNCALNKSTNPGGGDLANHVAVTKLVQSPL